MLVAVSAQSTIFFNFSRCFIFPSSVVWTKWPRQGLISLITWLGTTFPLPLTRSSYSEVAKELFKTVHLVCGSFASNNYWGTFVHFFPPKIQERNFSTQELFSIALFPTSFIAPFTSIPPPPSSFWKSSFWPPIWRISRYDSCVRLWLAVRHLARAGGTCRGPRDPLPAQVSQSSQQIGRLSHLSCSVGGSGSSRIRTFLVDPDPEFLLPYPYPDLSLIVDIWFINPFSTVLDEIYIF